MMTLGHRRILASILLVFALMALPFQAAFANGTKIDLDVSMSNNFEVRITGSLTSGGKGLPREPVLATIAGSPLKQTRTEADGRFEITATVPERWRTGEQRLAVQFRGGRGFDAAESGVRLQFSGQTDAQAAPAAKPNRRSEPKPAAKPKPTVELSAEASDSQPAAGGMVNLSGKVQLSDGTPLAGVGISLADPSGPVEASYTLTGDDGAFLVRYEVPMEAKGDWALQLTADGGAMFPAKRQGFTLSVKPRPPAPTPSSAPFSAHAASPTPVSPSPEASPSAEPSGAAPTESAAPVVTESSPPQPSSLGWALAGILGGAMLLAVAGTGAVALARARRPEVGDAAGLEVLDEGR